LLEVERGKTTINNMQLLDFWKCHRMTCELSNLPLEDALQPVHLYFERDSPKAEQAARRWLVRYLTEGTPVCGTSPR